MAKYKFFLFCVKFKKNSFLENKIREKLFVQEEQTEEKVEEPTKKSKVTADNETAK